MPLLNRLRHFATGGYLFFGAGELEKEPEMTNIKTFFTLLLLLMLACSSTAPIAVMSQPISTRAPPATPAPPMCQINTGVEAGTVNLRTCGGTYYRNHIARGRHIDPNCP